MREAYGSGEAFIVPLSVCLSVPLYVCPSVCPSVPLSVCLSVCLSVPQSVPLSLCPSVCLSEWPLRGVSLCSGTRECLLKELMEVTNMIPKTIDFSRIQPTAPLPKLETVSAADKQSTMDCLILYPLLLRLYLKFFRNLSLRKPVHRLKILVGSILTYDDLADSSSCFLALIYRANPVTERCLAAMLSGISVSSPDGTHSSHTRRQSWLNKGSRDTRGQRIQGGEEKKGENGERLEKMEVVVT